MQSVGNKRNAHPFGLIDLSFFLAFEVFVFREFASISASSTHMKSIRL